MSRLLLALAVALPVASPAQGNLVAAQRLRSYLDT